jgi:MFS family permease
MLACTMGLPDDDSVTLGLLRDLPRFRNLWLSKAISSAGAGVGRAALVLFVAPSGPGAVSAVLAGAALPLLLGPVAGAVADRVDQRRLLASAEAGQCVVWALLAVTRPPLAALLPLVVLGSLLATAGFPAGGSAVRRLVPAGRRSQANALFGLAANLQILIGPAIGGALAGLAGARAAFAVNAASFAVSALLLGGLGPLPPVARGAGPGGGTAGGAAAAGGGQGKPDHRPGAGADARGRKPGLLADTLEGLRHTAGSRFLRGLMAGMFLYVAFASVDNVALVFLVRQPLRGSGAEYGLIAASFGVGMIAASVALTAWAGRRSAAFWLTGGILATAVGTIATGIAPVAAAAVAGQALAGAGNSAENLGGVTLVQQRVPAHMLGRALGVVYGGLQLAATASAAATGPLVALAGPRAAFAVGGLGALAGLAILVPALRGAHASSLASETPAAGSLVREPPLQLGEPDLKLGDPVAEEL